MIEAVMLWNEPNNLSHWDFHIDSDWNIFAEVILCAAQAIREVNPDLKIVLGGLSPVDPNFVRLLTGLGVIDAVDVVSIHGFPLDWNHWSIHDWPEKVAEIQQVTSKPVWVSETGVSSFGAEEVQSFGLERTAELLLPLVERVHWYSLFDLPATWTATTRHKEAEGSAYYRHYYMGLLREDGSPKLASRHFVEGLGICQWFHFEDHRLELAAQWLRELKVKHLRTGLSWADSYRPNAETWFDRQMQVLEPFETTVTLCFTPEHLGRVPHHTSPPLHPPDFAAFAKWAIQRYAPARAVGTSTENCNPCKGKESLLSKPHSDTGKSLAAPAGRSPGFAAWPLTPRF